MILGKCKVYGLRSLCLTFIIVITFRTAFSTSSFLEKSENLTSQRVKSQRQLKITVVLLLCTWSIFWSSVPSRPLLDFAFKGAL